MNIYKNKSLTNKTLIYFISFSLLIVLFVIIFQYLGINIIHKRAQINNLKSNKEIILNAGNNIINTLEELSLDNNYCIELYSSNQIYNFNNRKCVNNNTDLIKIKRKLKTSSKDESLVKLDNSVLYYLKIDNSTYVYIYLLLDGMTFRESLTNTHIIYFIFVLLLSSYLVSYYVSKLLNKPIIKITEKARDLAKGKSEIDYYDYGIDEINDLRDTLNYARSEINKTDSLRRDLMANVSHDLKTPLTMIKAYAEMIKDLNSNDKKKTEDNLNIIIDEVDRLNLLVNDILELSKLESNNLELKIEEYDLVKEIKNIIKKYEIIKETENYIIELNSPKEAMVKADKKQINEVLYNLINNAINYTGKDLKVIINVKNEKDSFLVEIIDSGKGLSKEDIKLIWNKYYKNEKNHQRNKIGTGLGLSIVQSILNKHNFDYGVKSKIGTGSTFYFKIAKKV